MTDDPVNHPKHYTEHPSGVECITITRHMNFNLGNALKYIWRAGLKSPDPVQDLKKAAWYIQDEIARLQAPAEQTIQRLVGADRAKLEIGVPPNWGNGKGVQLTEGDR